jgi:hypothetical protein
MLLLLLLRCLLGGRAACQCPVCIGLVPVLPALHSKRDSVTASLANSEFREQESTKADPVGCEKRHKVHAIHTASVS